MGCKTSKNTLDDNIDDLYQYDDLQLMETIKYKSVRNEIYENKIKERKRKIYEIYKKEKIILR